MQNFKYLSVLFLLLLCGCEEGKNIDKASVKKAIEDTKIHRVIEADVMEISTNLGAKITATLNGFSNTEDSLQYIKKLSALKIKVSYYTLQSEKTESLSEVEKQVIEAYEYSLENNLPHTYNIQPINDLEILYSSMNSPEQHTEIKNIIFVNLDKTYLLKSKVELLN